MNFAHLERNIISIDMINELIQEITSKHSFLNLSLIEQINNVVSNKLITIMDEFNLGGNKYVLLSNLVKFGYELEKSINKNNNHIISLQIASLSGLLEPIIIRIKNICLELNLELVDELKKLVLNLVNEKNLLNPIIKEHIKLFNIKHFCKSVNYQIERELVFEEFGITIKISNPFYKNIFSQLVEKFDIFISNNARDQRFDWYWKALDNEKQNSNIVMSEEKQIFNTENANNNEFDDLLPDIKMEEFKIVQKQPPSVIFETNNKFEFNKQLKEPESRITINSLIVEDESFLIPIDNTDYTDLA